MKVLGVLNEPVGRLHGSTWYRCVIPLMTLERAGLADVAYLPRDEFDRARVERRLGELIQGYDVILFQRGQEMPDISPQWKRIAMRLRAQGKVVIMDYDDDMTGLYRSVETKYMEGGEVKSVHSILPDLGAFSAVTVSTPYLKTLYAKMGGAPVFVLPNTVVPSMFGGHRRSTPKDAVVIGLTGSPSHRDDWDVVAGPLRRVLGRYKSARVFVAGYCPESIAALPGVMRPTLVAPNGSTTTEVWASFNQYGLWMAQMDILLCPVNPADQFSFGRSPIKALEGWASRRRVGVDTGGCAVIATGGVVPCYRDTIDHGHDGLLVEHTEEEWEAAIERTVRDQSFRRRLQVNGAISVGDSKAGPASAARLHEMLRSLMVEEAKHTHDILAEWLRVNRSVVETPE
jgi:hypothetical protein